MSVPVSDPYQNALADVNAWDAAAERMFTPCGDGTMGWRAWGHGRTLLLLHGGAGSWRHWIRNLPVLAARYRVLAPDMPGLGDSDMPPGPWSPQASAGIVAAGLERLLKPGETFDLVGFSAGAMLAGFVAAALKRRCGTLVLVGAGGLGTARNPVVLEKVRSKQGEERVQAHRTNLERLMIADPRKIDAQALAIQEWNTQHTRVSSVGFAASAALRDALAEGGGKALKAIWGSEDAVARTSLAERCAVLRALRPQVEIRIVPGAGHWVAYEAAEIFNELLVAMLDGAADFPGGERMTIRRPYDDIRIVDLTGELSAYTTRLFADLGAEIIMVEPPGGRAERRIDPLPSAPGYGGAAFAFLNAGKKSVVLDWHTDEGAKELARLVASAQIVVVETDAKALLPQILAVPGQRVVTTVTHFGLDGPYADYAGSDLVTQSLGGIAWLSGVPGEPPLRLPGDQSAMVASLYAAAVTALALWDHEMHGHGHVIDVSAQECIAHSLQNAPQVWDLEQRILSRGGEGIRDATEDLFACKDGHVFLAAPLSLPMSWKAVLDWMAEEGDLGRERLSHPDWANRPLRATAAMRREFRGMFEHFIANKTRAEMREQALRRKIVMAPVSKIGDLADDPQLIFRQFFADVPHPALGRALRLPGAPYRLSEPVWHIDRAAPTIGEHTVELSGARRAAQA